MFFSFDIVGQQSLALLTVANSDTKKLGAVGIRPLQYSNTTPTESLGCLKSIRTHTFQW